MFEIGSALFVNAFLPGNWCLKLALHCLSMPFCQATSVEIGFALFVNAFLPGN